MASESDIVALKRRRAILKAACTRINTYVNSIVAVTPLIISQLEERKLKLEQNWNDYNDIQTQLELADDSELDDRANFEEAFYNLSAKIRDLLRPPTPSHNEIATASSPSTFSDVSRPLFNIRLPKLDLPKFTGRYDEWVSFHDVFHSVIHSNHSLSDVHKLQYLRAATSDEAHKVISSLEISDSNYTVAWNLLKQRYDNQRVIVQSHLKAIIELPSMSKENALELRQIADGASRHIQALKALKRPTDYWDDLLVFLLSNKLDSITIREWQRSLTADQLPTTKQFLDFLTHHCQVLESMTKSSSTIAKGANTRSQSNNKLKTSCNAAIKAKCHFCNAEHPIYQCKQFTALSIPQRIENARSRNLCLNCLRSTSHNSHKCPSGSCRTCSRKHNTLLHLNSSPSEQSKAEDAGSPESASSNPAKAVVTHSLNGNSNSCIFLSTALVSIRKGDGSRQIGRALLDSGSQANFITSEFLNKLGLASRSINTSISGISGTVTNATRAVQIELAPPSNSFTTTINCLVTAQLTDDIPALTMKRSEFDIPRNLKLADPNFNISSKIDILIGAEVFWDLLCIGQIKASTKHPLLQKTKLGWILAGRLNSSPLQSQRIHSLHARISNAELNNQLAKLWQLEDSPSETAGYTSAEKRCEEHFLRTVTRNSEGRYVVELPLKEVVIDDLGETRDIALRRLRGLEKRLNRDSQLKQRYTNFIREYIELGHMKLVEEELPNKLPTYYLPHHCVVKEDAKGTKLRVVFDGSCKSSTGISLNDALIIGPTVQEDLVSILIRFRTSQYVLVADVIKMYRQVLVHPSQTRLQRILWREDSNSEPLTYELATVTYGTSSASYLATRCLNDLADRYASTFPTGSACVKRDFYVDDLLTGADTRAEAITIRDQVIQLLQLGGFELSKWRSNCPHLLKDVSNQSETFVPLSVDGDFRILGIGWDREHDLFRFSLSPSKPSDTVTKRLILSQVSRLFDPLGLLGPIFVVAKILLQNLWQHGLEWDESVPPDVHTKWYQIKTQLNNIRELQIPRLVKYHTNSKHVEIHGFCDASQVAFGACIYVRTGVGPNNYRSHLLLSKSRVAPLRATSLPRLELSAALLLSQLINKVKSSFDITNMRILLWSDSTITLNWIASPSRKWSVFVANRVGEIQRLTNPHSWRHVASSNNPADVLSRGLLPNELIDSDLWWHGPHFLRLPDSQWPSCDFQQFDHEMPKQKRVCIVATQGDCSVINDLVNKFSNLDKTCRVLAYCFRFFKHKGNKPSSLIVTAQEMSYSLNVLCRCVQKQAFPREYDWLSKDNSVLPSSSLISLCPFLGKDNLIRVGGRLRNSSLSFDASHQVLLPRNHTLTRRVIESEHIRNLHAGLQATMAAVRQRFWPLSLRSTTRNIINNCIVCFKVKPRFSEALMGSLPASRVSVSRPFAHCGVDYAGPVTLREGRRRNSRNHKAYIAVFVCFATKAIHLELVSDLTTDSFIATLKRFISRRGKPDRIHSDNATTFVGAQKQIKELYEFLKAEETTSSIQRFLQNHQTTWHFIPPNAPHFGGLWEAAVKSAKFHLARIIGLAHLTFEEMQTTLCEIEAILNSRPMSPLSSDPNDTSYLSPGHFLVGTPLNSFPNRNLIDVNSNALLRWQRIEQMRQHFWSRWSREYVSSLQERTKWRTSRGQQLAPGHLVLIMQPNLAPLQWATGRVEQVHPGADGVTRTATVRTARGSYVRPLSRLAILPLESNVQENM